MHQQNENYLNDIEDRATLENEIVRALDRIDLAVKVIDIEPPAPAGVPVVRITCYMAAARKEEVKT